jgi:hypothetical protein
MTLTAWSPAWQSVSLAANAPSPERAKGRLTVWRHESVKPSSKLERLKRPIDVAPVPSRQQGAVQDSFERKLRL